MKLLLVTLILIYSNCEVNTAECTIDEECKPLIECPIELKYFRDKKFHLLRPCGIFFRSTEHCCKINSQEISTNSGGEPASLKSTCPSTSIDITRTPTPTSVSNNKDHKNINLINNIKNCGIFTSNRISHGVDTNVHEFPSLTLLKYRSIKNNTYSFGCHGNLITKRYVLTAAHCIEVEDQELTSVRFGEHRISKEVDCDDYEDLSTCSKFKTEDVSIEKVILPEKYSVAVEGNDIALIKLCRDVELTKERKHIRTICLPVDESQQIDNLEEEDQNLIVAGWGSTHLVVRAFSDVLLKVSVPYLPNESCSKKLGKLKYSSGGIEKTVVIKDIHMCAGGKGKNDSCKGDSGSGLIGFALLNNKPRMFQHGIVSFGIECHRQKSLPAAYTRVSKFIGWILDNISES